MPPPQTINSGKLWGEFCDVTLTLKQGHQPDSGGWVKTDDYRCRHAFRHFMNLLNRAAYGYVVAEWGLAGFPMSADHRSKLFEVNRKRPSQPG